MPKVALVQLPSPFLDRAGAFEVAERAIAEARGEGAELVNTVMKIGADGAVRRWSRCTCAGRWSS